MVRASLCLSLVGLACKAKEAPRDADLEPAPYVRAVATHVPEPDATPPADAASSREPAPGWIALPSLPLEIQVPPRPRTTLESDYFTSDVLAFLAEPATASSSPDREAARAHARADKIGFRRFVLDRVQDDGWEIIFERGRGSELSYVVDVRREIAGRRYECGVSVGSIPYAQAIATACRSMRRR